MTEPVTNEDGRFGDAHFNSYGKETHFPFIDDRKRPVTSEDCAAAPTDKIIQVNETINCLENADIVFFLDFYYRPEIIWRPVPSVSDPVRPYQR